MSDKNTPPNTQGTRLPAIGKNGAELLSKEYRDALVNIVNAIRNLEVLLPQTDGANVLPPLKATVDISELSMRIILPPLNTSGGGSSTVPFSGSGAPTSSTLSISYSYVAGPTPSLYVDLTGLNLWVCTTAGTNSTSVWSQIASSGGGSSTAQQFIIIGDAGDYWIGLPYNNGTYGTLLQYIAKPAELACYANIISSKTIRGATYNYGCTPASTVSVTVNSVTYTGQIPYWVRAVTGGATETDYCIPDAILGLTAVWAIPAAFTVPNIPTALSGVAIVTGGTGYTAGTYNVSGGTGTAATVTIGVASGVITSATLATSGKYTALPTLTGGTISGGGGSGATFNFTSATPLVDINVDGRAWSH